MLRFLGIYPIAIVAALALATFIMKHQPVAQAAKPAPAPVRNFAAAAPQPAPVPAPPTQIVEGDPTGHYVTPVEVDGRQIPMLIDTGATLVALKNEDASELGIRPSPADFTMRIQTANGLSTAAHTWLPHVRVGMVEVHDVEAVVMSPGATATSLLGMSFLGKLRHFGASDGKMRLEQ